MEEFKTDSIEVDMEFETTRNIPIPSRLVDQVIGQEAGVDIIKKAAIQRRNVLLIGDPGTGKSMLGQALAELLPKEELEDILCLPNQNDSHTPRVMTVPTIEGRKIVDHYKHKEIGSTKKYVITRNSSHYCNNRSLYGVQWRIR
ncbi:MAG: ATP-binding protein [Candidatus Hodarchaeales archaeon]